MPTWSDLLPLWRIIEVDFQEIYGLDIGAPGFLASRSWRWLTVRVFGLLSTDRGFAGTGGSRLQRALRPVKIELPPGKGTKP